jgi:CDP-diacylglycerol--glycerol-3-phosphate 3-phosphatidyltransferase
MVNWSLNHFVWIWLAAITFWVLAKKTNYYWRLIAWTRKKTGYAEKKEQIKSSWLESQIRSYAQDVKQRAPNNLNPIEKIFVPLLRLRRYTGTIANLISILRILLAIIVTLLLIIYYLTMRPVTIMITALLCFVTASLLDLLDGATARALGEVSPLGKILDPLADKILLASALILAYVYLPSFTFWALIRQEGCLFILSLLKMAAKKLPFSMASQANWWGKIKTTVELIAASFLFLCPLNQIFITIANIIFIISIPLAIGSIVGYLSSVSYEPAME